MPRGPRLAFENSFLHVFNRGINKESIFLSDSDYQFFLRKLLGLKSRFDHSLYAFCLMPNHFHLSIRIRKAPIAKIMSSLLTSYSMFFNKKHGHFGSVFQNRYKSILVERDTYFMQLSRYIYLNPVSDGLVKDPMQYPYSSFRESVGKEPLQFLDSDIVRLIGETSESHEEYAKFVYSGMKEDLSEFEQLFLQRDPIVGSRLFSTFAHKKYLRRKKLRI